MLAASLDGLEYVALPGRRAADPLPGSGAHALVTRVVEVAEQARTPHLHSGTAELIHVLEGSGEHWQDGERRRVERGDLVVVPAGVPHVTLAADASAPLRLLCVFPVGSVDVEELEGEVRIGA